MDSDFAIYRAKKIRINSCHLCLDFYLENGTCDGERVTDDDEDVPAAHKVQLVWPWNLFAAASATEAAILLLENQTILEQIHMDLYL